MTMDEEMKDLSAKAAKASPQKENCTNNAQFPLFVAIKPCRDGGSKSEKRCQDAFYNACEGAENAIFRVQAGVCLSLELCFLPRRGAHLQKNEGLKLDCVEKSRKMKGRKIKKNKKQDI